MSDLTTAAPTAEGERLPVMDILRGFALLGIFLMNIEFFTRSMQSFSGGVTPAEGLDHLLGVAIYVFVQGKFWVLFALLFGMGFALMRERAIRAGRPFAGQYLRRTLLLALFGALHIVFFWVGDILFAYSLAALVLLAFVGGVSLVFDRLPGTAAGILGMLFYVGMAGLWLLMGVGLMFMPESMADPVRQEMLGYVEDGARAAAVYRDGSFMEITQQRIADFQFLFTGATIFQIPMMVGVFLIGTWLVGTGHLADPASNRGFFVKLAIGGLLLGAIGVGASLGFGVEFDLVEDFAESTVALALMTLGSLPMALGYLAIVVLLATGALRGPLGVLAPAGRMALTNYLMQSVICAFIFYGYGLGLFGQIGRTGQVGIVLAVFIAQVAFSHWWLARFRYGPMEWLWRAGTYLQWPPMRRVAHA
mgnify:CR=1 FL=1